jgi:hypothetical protein
LIPISDQARRSICPEIELPNLNTGIDEPDDDTLAGLAAANLPARSAIRDPSNPVRPTFTETGIKEKVIGLRRIDAFQSNQVEKIS